MTTNDKLKHTIALIYINLNTKYPYKKFTGYFYVQGYKTYLLLWINYSDDYSASKTYSNTQVGDFTWDFDGEFYGDGEKDTNN